MAARKQNTLDTQILRARLKLRSQTSELALRQKYPEADKFFKKYQLRPGQIREHAARLLTSGALAGSLLLSAPTMLPVIGPVDVNKDSTPQSSPATLLAISQVSLAKSLQQILPPAGQWNLDPGKEEKISSRLKDDFGINARAELDGNRLPNSYGRMGAEQLLPRYPGDTAQQHDGHWDKGQTPGLGGWGYFARSKEEMTPELYDTEKYYVAVQTLYIPDWNSHTKYYVNWFKYRHMVAINPANGKAIVVAVADAGPANWTGKHFGGSPEVMEYLGINYGQQDHPVVLFFLDDPKHEIPLGPLEYNVEGNKKLLAS